MVGLRSTWWVPALAGGFLFTLLGSAEILSRANLEVDGVVVRSVLNRKEPNRPVRMYVLRSPAGVEFRYAAGPVDHALSQDIPDGARVIKRQGELTYSIDGRTVDDFPTSVYIGALCFTASAFVGGSIAGVLAFRRYYKSL